MKTFLFSILRQLSCCASIYRLGIQHVFRVLLFFALLSFSACGAKEPGASPLLGTWSFSSGMVNMIYGVNSVNYNITGPARAVQTYTFEADNEGISSDSKGKIIYTTATVNGENQVTISEKSNSKVVPRIYSWKVEGSTLTLTSKNFLAGQSAADAVSMAKLMGGIMAASSTPFIFPNYQNITSVSDIITIYSFTKK